MYSGHLEYHIQFYRFGLIVNYWTTRKAKHKSFKHLANVIGNLTNINYATHLHCIINYISATCIHSDTLQVEEIQNGPGVHC